MNLKAARGSRSLREMVKRVDRRTIDVPMLSKLENGLCLPTVDAMPDIERAYGLLRTQLYSPAELDFGVKAEPATPKRDYHRLTCKRTFRLPPSLNDILTPETLHACGYGTAQDWFYACLRRLNAQHAAICSRSTHQPPHRPLTD